MSDYAVEENRNPYYSSVPASLQEDLDEAADDLLRDLRYLMEKTS